MTSLRAKVPIRTRKARLIHFDNNISHMAKVMCVSKGA
jgi:hypothetical protein